MTPEIVSSGLEHWTLHTLTVGAMLLGFAAFALVLAGAGYREMVRSRLTLRLTNETLHAIWDVLADLLLFESVVLGFVLLSMDTMAETTIPLPLFPLAALALLVGLGLRAFYGGRLPGTRAWWATVALIGAACGLNWLGLTFVMNGPDTAWLTHHPSALWSFWHHLRSNENPILAAQTFLWAQPALVSACLWMVISALRRVSPKSAAGVEGTVAEAALPLTAMAPEPRPHFAVHIDVNHCTACAVCMEVCPQHALITRAGDPSPYLFNGHCDGCGLCVEQCPVSAIRLLARELA